MLIQQQEVCFHNKSSLTNESAFRRKKGRGKVEQREMSRKHLHELLLCCTLLFSVCYFVTTFGQSLPKPNISPKLNT